MYVGIADLSTVLKELSEVIADWKKLGDHLGLGYGKMKEIVHDCGDDARDCMREELAWWLRGNGAPPTWRTLIDALYKMEEPGLAKHIKEADLSTVLTPLYTYL